MIFRSEGHKERFLEAINRTGKIYGGKVDAEYGAALLLLTADVGIWEKVDGYVEWGKIRFPSMQEVHFSSSESVVVRTANNLFNGTAHVDPVEFVILDDANFNVVLQALRMRKTPMGLGELNNG